jgi:thiamine-monophosphate kinase
MGQNDEFLVIDRLFKPLAGLAPEARGLMDDISLLPARDDVDLVVTTDAIVEGVHFLSDDPLDLVAQKLLRLNLSDLAAKGARPYGYQLMCAWPHGFEFAQKAMFCKGLRRDQDLFGLSLFGGDTVSTSGPLTFCVTAFGHVPKGMRLSRSGAQAGHKVLVSGPIGEAYLGLKVRQGQFSHLSFADKEVLTQAYQVPQPRLDLADMVLAYASASLDVSDGLLADAEQLAMASDLALRLDLGLIPTSRLARALMAQSPPEDLRVMDLLSGGDDYQILCTANATGAVRLIEAGFIEIGVCHGESEAGIELFNNGQKLDIDKKGYIHG